MTKAKGVSVLKVMRKRYIWDKGQRPSIYRQDSPVTSVLPDGHSDFSLGFE